MVTPPQIDEERIFELSKMQIRAIFYFLTFDETERVGRPYVERFAPHNSAHKGNWGDLSLIGFMDLTREWDLRWLLCTADGYFKSEIKRMPKKQCWSWALEWNKSYRIVGFFGDELAVRGLNGKLLMPDHSMKTHREKDGSIIRSRKDIPLANENDSLFSRS
jgi:hypothetical protein